MKMKWKWNESEMKMKWIWNEYEMKWSELPVGSRGGTPEKCFENTGLCNKSKNIFGKSIYLFIWVPQGFWEIIF